MTSSNQDPQATPDWRGRDLIRTKRVIKPAIKPRPKGSVAVREMASVECKHPDCDNLTMRGSRSKVCKAHTHNKPWCQCVSCT